MDSAFAFDPRDPSVRADPYAAYERLRADGPASYLASARTWFVTSHELCQAVLRDPSFSARQGQDLRSRSDELPTTMLTTDPPEHTRLRGAAAPAFGPAAVAGIEERLAPVVRRTVADVVGRLRAGAEVDVVADLARPLAVRAVAELLGLGADDLPGLAEWGEHVGAHLDPFADPDGDEVVAEAMHAMLDRFAELMHEASGDGPALGGLAVLAAAFRAGDISAREALSAAGLLVVGGLDPLVAVVGSSVAALMESGEVVATSPDQVRALVEELLRYDPPVQFTARRATRDLGLGADLVREGEGVVVLLGAANRDPATCPHADRLQPGPHRPHLAFGAGVHTCPGAPVVRLLLRLVLEALAAEGSPALEAGAEPPVRDDAVVPRGFDHLWVRMRPS